MRPRRTTWWMSSSTLRGAAQAGEQPDLRGPAPGRRRDNGISEISQKGTNLNFYLDGFDLQRVSALCAMEKYKSRLLFSAGEKPYLALRLKAGETVLVCDGQGTECLCEVTDAGEMKLNVLKRRESTSEAAVRVSVYMAFPKADKLELLAQKLTELGVTRLVPVEMERSVRHFEKVERLRRIAREAAKQCRRALPMEITEPMPWQKAVIDMRARELLVAPWEEATDGRLTALPPCNDIGLLIGPEAASAPGRSRKAARKPSPSARAYCARKPPRSPRPPSSWPSWGRYEHHRLSHARLQGQPVRYRGHARIL